MYRDPDIIESKPTTKTDSSAPARSTIRRQRTVRYNPHLRDHPSSSRSHVYSRTRAADRGRSLLEALDRGDSSVVSTRFSTENDFEIEAEADLAHAEASLRRRLESGRALLRDALSYERPSRRLRVNRDAPSVNNMAPPVPALQESRHHASRSDSIHHRGLNSVPLVRREGQPDMPEYMPTPPHSSGDTLSRSSPQRSTQSFGAASVTPRFAPAHRFDNTGEITFQEYLARHRIHNVRDPDIDDHSLRRVRRHGSPAIQPSGRDSPQDDLDGLGDRRRSFSPENDSWETLLTTMTPDERLPSTHSSFTSATASASSLSSNSASSYGTLVTAPSSSTETLDAYPTICDNTDTEESGSEDEQNLSLQELNTEDSHGREPSSHSSNRATLRRRSHQPERVEHLTRHRRILEREEELQQIQANLDRLERQVPEEWWAAAGRDRNLGSRSGRERL